MTQPQITQDNVHILLPSKIAQLADRLLKNKVATDMTTALRMIYTSPVYTKLEQESTKYWWLGVDGLYYDLMSIIAQTNSDC